MHYIYVCARRDPAKTWAMGRFQIIVAKVEMIMTNWEEIWKKNIPLEDVIESKEEEEDTSADKKDEEYDKEEEEEEEADEE